uniref:Peroxisomal membrane protein 4 n=1 Tax=Palpitomonas bilix TaxID=652834 RepID=A0A7S3GA22_9EUKA
MGIDNIIMTAMEALRNGAAYGTKIRAPHAFVMLLIFSKRSIRDKLKSVIKLTAEHARKLGTYAFGYKLIQKGMEGVGVPKLAAVFAAGTATSSLVFGKDDAINSQLAMYVLSRVVFGCVRWLVSNGKIPPALVQIAPFRVISALLWGIVMVMFEWADTRQHLQSSMVASMHDIYDNPKRDWDVKSILPMLGFWLGDLVL